MSLVNRRTKEEIEIAKLEATEAALEKIMSTEDKFDALRETLREQIKPGMQTHEVQDLLVDLCEEVSALERSLT